MIVYNLDVVSIRLLPVETDSPPVVDSNAVLALPVAGQFFETVAGKNPQISQSPCPVQHSEFHLGPIVQIAGQTLNQSSFEDLFSLSRPEGPEHRSILA